VPGHGVIAAGDRLADSAFDFTGYGGDAKTGAGNEHAIHIGSRTQLNGGVPNGSLADSGRDPVVFLVKRTERGDFISADSRTLALTSSR